MNENLFITLIKNAQHKISDGVSLVISNFTNYIAKDAQVENVGTITPWGFGSFANPQSNMLCIPIYGTNQHTAVIGVQLVIPKIKNDLVDGEAWIHSNKYLLATQNTTVNAYRINDLNYFATLPNGQFMGAMMLNRINEIQTQINYLTTLVQQLQNHTHKVAGVQSGGSTITSAVPTETFNTPTTPTTLAKDSNYISNENYLINDKGTMYA